ncbi:hypothetical protein SG35_023555 [Thalassomonas actiniarum]|uniref:Uncharacterized protein n=2 Tax=Thalassomonas actiniarum TaxID=485447 RepID=A0AAE9YNQ8_9GAMM|nr:hypothetical protein SG35_023555 [Thalassomonas actiniarum]
MGINKSNSSPLPLFTTGMLIQIAGGVGSNIGKGVKPANAIMPDTNNFSVMTADMTLEVGSNIGKGKEP